MSNFAFQNLIMPFAENNARLLRTLAVPVTPFYAVAMLVRNRLFDRGILRSETFPFPLICVGNLCAGGSGKTPMTEYLVRLLSPTCHVGVVSRGYGRKTQGNLLATDNMTASQIGDEPMQYLQKFGHLPQGFTLYIAKDRCQGIAELKAHAPDCKAVILDDAYQHRRVRAGLNILLTEYRKPYFIDYLLPIGNLRESRAGSRRAQIIVVTKCPPDLSQEQKQAFLKQCKPQPGQQVFFSRIAYEAIKPVKDAQTFVPENGVVLFSGIANPAPIEEHLQSQGIPLLHHFRFGDHHEYTRQDLMRLERACRQDKNTCREDRTACLLTTEKDFARLAGHPDLGILAGIPLCVLPMRIEFLFGEAKTFDDCITEYINKNR